MPQFIRVDEKGKPAAPRGFVRVTETGTPVAIANQNQAILDRQKAQFPTSAEMGGEDGAMVQPETRSMGPVELIPHSMADLRSTLGQAGKRAAEGTVRFAGELDENPVGTLYGAAKGLAMTPIRGAQALRTFASGAMAGDSQQMAEGTADFIEEIPNVLGVKAAMQGGASLIQPARQAVAGGLRTSAQRSIKQVLNPTTKGNKVIAERIAPRLAESGPVAMTLKGYQSKVKGIKGEVGEALGEAHAKVPTEKRIQTQGVIDAIEKSKIDNQAVIDGVVVEPEIVAAADKLKGIIEEFGPDVSYKSMVALRQRWDRTVAKAKGFVQQDLGAMADVKRDAVTAIREELAREAPSVAKINAEYSFWANADKVISDTVTRKAGQATPLGEQIATGAGAAAGIATGGLGSAIKSAAMLRAITKVFRSTGWRTVSARVKSKMADAIASGDTAAIEQIGSQVAPRGFVAPEAKATAVPAAERTTAPAPKPRSAEVNTKIGAAITGKSVQEVATIRMNEWAQDVRHAQQRVGGEKQTGQSASTLESNAAGKEMEEMINASNARVGRSYMAKENSPLAWAAKYTPGRLAEAIERGSGALFDQIKKSFEEAAKAEKSAYGESQKEISFGFGSTRSRGMDALREVRKK